MLLSCVVLALIPTPTPVRSSSGFEKSVGREKEGRAWIRRSKTRRVRRGGGGEIQKRGERRETEADKEKDVEVAEK